ncbi:hypothetical protein [Umezakia ovalisporum]|jgi:hypothetical protein|uniref:Uncharacterized protein n=2 Tax=Umezakia ovalisporum TaxID=75695 RepID=A0AA43KGC8_9CYAN|nr:hypothetical protein [Umezakia ovalisporum]MBI1241194.1 hypothetical protein [Nostoc sp. RI_552]MDH6057736.1 hypothetical protein [Umezakia ovalisporum FSS-43]MDH6064768.1 hypothetical protein [Umezakia ovalisporum FSS-62]MDH6067368.1 hypothetical protein [Umezakia ovalisporum APH033B]MDH6070323.1 hypothetical protein [Umezakia ovalisporum CobakiLakeA]
MASKNQGLPPISPEFLSQLVFGGFLILVLRLVGASTPLSIFLGIIAGFILGWFTNSSKNSPEEMTVASSDGIDAGLKYWLFFLLGFVFLGYSPPISILLGGIAAIGGGWITAWWGSKEEMITQPLETSDMETNTSSRERITKQQRRRITSRRYRRASGSFNFRFWQK